MNTEMLSSAAPAWLTLLSTVLPLLASLLLVTVKRAPVLPVVSLATAPALVLAGLGAAADLSYPGVLLGLQLGLDDTGRVFLLFTSVLWAAAGLYAAFYMKEDAGKRRFFFFHLLCMAGNTGLIVSRDIPGFYMFFALMSLSAYGLVIHDGTVQALRAGRIYIAMAVLGEALLAIGLFLVADAAGSIELAAAPAAVAASSNRDLIIALVISGFGIKAGLVSLHMWLPLAHPVAPVPASALLSGAMIKAGLLGWIRFLPLGHAFLPGWGWFCVAFGLFGAFYAVAAGALQNEKKTILAYSSVSQMGIMTAGVGIGLLSPEAWPAALAAILAYALHHAFAKGALFLSTGVSISPALSSWGRALLLLAIILPALSLAGAPFTTGEAAKAALKEALQYIPDAAGPLGLALQASAMATTYLMLRFLSVTLVGNGVGKGHAASPGLILPWAFLVVFAPFAFWFLSFAGGFPAAGSFSVEGITAAAGPLIAGALAYMCLEWLMRKTGRPQVPPGDLLEVAVPAFLAFQAKLKKINAQVALAWAYDSERMERFAGRWTCLVERFEIRLSNGAAGWILFLVIASVVSLLLVNR